MLMPRTQLQPMARWQLAACRALGDVVMGISATILEALATEASAAIAACNRCASTVVNERHETTGATDREDVVNDLEAMALHAQAGLQRCLLARHGWVSENSLPNFLRAAYTIRLSAFGAIHHPVLDLHHRIAS